MLQQVKMAEHRDAFGKGLSRGMMQRVVLAKTLISAGIITDRTAHVYAEWVNMKELESEAHEIPGIAVVVEGIEDLRRINAERKLIGQKW